MYISKAQCTGCGRPMDIKRLECSACGVATEGDFEVPPLARLSVEDQAFVHSFIRHHGSIKKMERILGVSYPTVKNRLRAITETLDQSFVQRSPNQRVLEALAAGDISVDEALEKLS